MTGEASTMVVVARAALEGALRAALPHVARRIPEERPTARPSCEHDLSRGFGSQTAAAATFTTTCPP